MSSALQIISELTRRGVVIRAEGETIRLKPRSRLDDVLLARVREAKPAILEALRGRPATCAASCYQVEPGRWIHHPWDGCTRGKAEAAGPQRQVQVECWHCRGSKACECTACWQAGPGGCVACKGRGQVWQWVQ